MEFTLGLSAAVLSRYNLINATAHKEISHAYTLKSIGCWWDFGLEVFNNLKYINNTPWINEVHAICG